MSSEKVLNAICGNCAMWQVQAMSGPVEIGAARRGICNMLPPTPFPKFDNTGRIIGQLDLRSQPKETSVCGMFTPHPDAVKALQESGDV